MLATCHARGAAPITRRVRAPWTRTELQARLGDIDELLVRLEEEGVVVLVGDGVRAGRGTRHLERVGLI
jgi:hypothetical protein